ncbi:MAG: protein-methionine-sulfoxide reductase catalytic subunit MsrP [Methylophilaceae bacterium]|nr:protein-methionine-sulfoxide reductase catalytic subunit MsrP [Methylophilaceae bacterium]NCA27306.1 protein-methionine-sulfoxide reductase catalytic subunit MsrP [Methylophilaceae bacterium]
MLPSEITPEHIYKSRRFFIKSLGAGIGSIALMAATAKQSVALISALPGFIESKDKRDALTPYKHITTYNNYYEFGTSKSDPYENSQSFKTDPWSITIEGEVNKPITLSLDEIIKLAPLEERIYRLRCVEGWSMVVPWIGIPLSALLKKVAINNNAKFVEFISVERPNEMVGQRTKILDWPYKEGLRIDEAMHPLTILAVGLYGKLLPNQNGAPIRLVVPWKYGFKSAKAIVKIRLTEKMPITSWMQANSNEYGFYSNVNPEVDHPRWTQATERAIGDGFLSKRRKTEMFNGYTSQVESLYRGMDLRRNF